jgi:hypothetical protein
LQREVFERTQNLDAVVRTAAELTLGAPRT